MSLPVSLGDGLDVLRCITEHAFPCGDTFYTMVYFTENPPPRYKLCDPSQCPDGYYQEYNVGYDSECTGTST